MKRVIVSIMALTLLLGSVVSAQAGKKPASVKFFLHGTEMLGEVDMANNFGAAYNKMDTTEPDGPAPKSFGISAWGGPPWNDCAGMFILPVWTGAVAGKIVGDIKISLYSVSGPRSVTVQIWPDVSGQTCASNDVSEGQYPEPAAQATIALTPGAGVTEAVIEDVNFKAVGILMLQIRPTSPAPGRLLYDAADFASSIEFKCIPARGKSCV
jgi:hypothetical protein